MPKGLELDALRKIQTNKFSLLQKEGAKAKGFLYKLNNPPSKLLKEFDVFFSEKLLPKNMAMDQFLGHINTELKKGSLQEELLRIFEPWVYNLGVFKDQVMQPLEGLVINSVAAVRSGQGLDSLQINPQSMQAQKSDQQFVNLFLQKLSKEDLIREINVLRIDPLYLKFMNLQEDFKGKLTHSFFVKQSGNVALPTQEDIVAMKKNLKTVQESPKNKEKEVKDVLKGIVELLTYPKGTVRLSQINNNYLQRYLFDTKNFNQAAKDGLNSYLSKVVIKPIVRVNIADYFKQVVDQAVSYQDIIEFMKVLERTPIQPIFPRFIWNKVILKTDKKYTPSELRTLATKIKNQQTDPQEIIESIIDVKKNSQSLIVSPDQIEEVKSVKNKISTISFNNAQEVKEQLNVIFKNTLFDNSVLENLPVNENLFQIIKTLDLASQQRRG